MATNRTSLALARMSEFELRVCLRFNRASRRRSLRTLFRIVSRLGDGVFWYALMLALLLVYGRDAVPAVLHMLVVGPVCVLAYKWLKSKTVRTRPFVASGQVHNPIPPLDQYSFPSGHTLHAVAFCVLVVAYHPALAWLVVPFTVLVALSRLVLGLHYPTDVIAGALLGAAIATLSLMLV